MSATKARDILGILLDRVERIPDRTRQPSERAPRDFASAGDRDSFDRVLADAERQGAITVARGRGETRHLTERIRLRDATRLYEFLGRIPALELAREALGLLRNDAAPSHGDAAKAIDIIGEAWLRGERPFGLGTDRPLHASEFIRALDAALSRDPLDRRDLRTYSGQTTGNTKLIERHASRIAGFLKHIGRLDPDLSEDEAMASLGLEKFPQPVLVAGPLCVANSNLSGMVYAGIAPEQASLIAPIGRIRSVLTIENLASFNRHVREARAPDDIVVYTGGFPSRAVTAALLAMSGWPEVVRIHHWGDVDQGGLRIALHLASLLPVPIIPHLMNDALARSKGVLAKPIEPLALPSDHAWHSLAMLLEGENAHYLEQELIDPEPVHIDFSEET